MKRYVDVPLIRSLVMGWALCLPLILFSCGEEAECGLGVTLVGEWVEEEAQAVVEVTGCLVEVVGREPNALVNFVREDSEFRGVAWRDYRLPGVVARNESEGYRGLWDAEFCMVLVRTFGEAEAFLRELLEHELLHALGYTHGEEMREVEREVRSCVNTRPD